MHNLKFDEISRSLELFFSDDFENGCSIPTQNKDTVLPLDNHDDDIFGDDIHDSEKHKRKEYKLKSKQMSCKNLSEDPKIEEELDFESQEEFDSNPLQSSSDQQDSFKFQQNSEIFHLQSKIKEMENEKPQKLQKSKIIKRDKNENKQQKYKSKMKKQGDRKIRTTVSQEKIKILEHLFPYIEKRLAYKGTLINLKDVAKIVNLGYSTILHKYKDYRRKGAVQKGLLLKSKDIKRKYHKSLVIERYIKDALKEQKFKTAKQLAQFISQKHKIKINRSIVSRHLNEMQRQKKCQYLGDLAESEQKCNENILDEHVISLREFSQVFFGLKNEKFNFIYITVIRLYLVEGKLVSEVSQEAMTMNIVNLVVIATENHLISYFPISPNEDQQISNKGSSYIIRHSAYQALYDQLLLRVEEEQEYLMNSPNKVCIIFPYEDTQRQFVYRQKLMKKLMYEQINMLIIPPKLNHHRTNFIQKWFFQHVFKVLKDQSYLDVSELKQVLAEVMNEKQGSLSQFALDMIYTIKKEQ